MKNNMWGGRFGSAPAAIMQQINASIDVDVRLWREDLAGSRAHASMLRDQGILSAEDAAAILAGLTGSRLNMNATAWRRMRRWKTSTCMSSIGCAS
jgi:argininosuccinate lyase